MGQKWNQEDYGVFSKEQRKVAIKTFIKYDHSFADTIAELGYPNRATLRLWWKEYGKTGVVSVGKVTGKSKYSDEQARRAVDHYLGHGSSLSRTMRALGYPKGRQTLCDWIDELAPGRLKYRGPSPKSEPTPLAVKAWAVAEFEGTLSEFLHFNCALDKALLIVADCLASVPS